MVRSNIELSCEHFTPAELNQNLITNAEGMKMDKGQSKSRSKRFRSSCRALNGFSGFTYIARISSALK